jgi:hypothetical protein
MHQTFSGACFVFDVRPLFEMNAFEDESITCVLSLPCSLSLSLSMSGGSVQPTETLRKPKKTSNKATEEKFSR